MLYQGEIIVDIDEIEEVVTSIQEAVIDSLKIAQEMILDFDEKQFQEELIEEYGNLEIGKMMTLIEMAEITKKTIFSTVLESYNNYLREGVDLKNEINNQIEDLNERIDRINFSIKASGIIVASTVILLPGLAPLIIGFNIPIFGIDMMRKKRNIEDLESIEYFQEKYDSIRPSFFKLTDILRTDYHKSNKTIKEFKRRAMEGEDVTKEIINLFDPEVIGLEEYKKEDENTYQKIKK